MLTMLLRSFRGSGLHADSFVTKTGTQGDGIVGLAYRIRSWVGILATR